ncbi:contractile injection system protein, VgrG/Pvc8 family [Pigmentibacter sp. JX0631]|uniref:contractile injection system protein, VgrG/Pvc8 family n=1 Tax=Pigmentibacter sp. JX0631 TaxID=2976982 RepID=UPI0024690F5B|nr:contractile injection system protein, VgrG/Pvc8 family [Pigmentibacter sp. JX0631]WGL59207.1 contractile injection system protein, VgrG/Pvc8 family [Pigmentibacter sp. JX0631]
MTIFSSISEVSITKNSAIFFDSKIPENNRIVESFELDEDSISEIYNLKLVIKFPYKNFKEENLKTDILNKKIQIKIVYNKLSDEKNEKVKFLNGIIKEATFVAFTSEDFLLELKIVPPIFLTTQNNAYRSWNKTTAKNVISDVLNTYTKQELKFDFILTKPSDILTRKNIVQYGETDYQFICRLMHEEHLNFIHTQSEEGAKLIITDDLENKVFEIEKAIPVKIQLSHSILNKNINTFINNFFGYKHSLIDGTQQINTQYIDPRNIKNIFTANTKIEQDHINTLHTKAYHGKSDKLLTDTISTSYTKNELNRKNTLNNKVSFLHHLNFLSVGEIIEFVYKSNADKNSPLKLDKYIVAKLTHNFIKEPHLADGKKTSVYNYSVNVIAYPLTEKFIADYAPQIASLKTPSLTTGIIFGEKPEELISEIEESVQYVGVVLDWPKIAKADNSSSGSEKSMYVLARMSQFWASKNSGAIFNPQPGDEVLLGFLDNDIERPVIIRYFYNSVQIPPKLTTSEDPNGLIFRGIGLDSTLEKNLKFTFIDDSEKKGDEAKNSAEIILTKEGLIEKNSKNIKLNTTENIESKSTKNTVIEATENLQTKSTKNTMIEATENLQTKSTKNTVIEATENTTIKASKNLETTSNVAKVKASGGAEINEISIS